MTWASQAQPRYWRIGKAITKVRAEQGTDSPLDRLLRWMMVEKVASKSGKQKGHHSPHSPASGYQ
jgi:hypothetical protein